MNYAIIENNIVINLAWLYPNTPFLNAVPCDDYPVAIGDTYSDGRFYRNGELVMSPLEEAEAASADMMEALNILGVTE